MLTRLISLCCFLFLFCVVAHAASFSDNANGTITDTTTELVWQQTSDSSTRTWQQSLDYCNDLSLAGQNDWRLPNIKELESIVDVTAVAPTINIGYFPATNASSYWSSTSYGDSTGKAWHVGFDYGGIYYRDKEFSHYVRCVQ